MDLTSNSPGLFGTEIAFAVFISPTFPRGLLACIAETGNKTTMRNNMKVRVWRVEGPDGFGPYGMDGPHDKSIVERAMLASGEASTGVEAWKGDDHRPGMWNDNIREIKVYSTLDWYCGFKSLAQYRRWFNNKATRKELVKHGATLVRYEVDVEFVRYGGHQVCFVKSEAQPLYLKSCDC